MNGISRSLNESANYRSGVATKRVYSDHEVTASNGGVSQNDSSDEKPIRKRSKASKKTPTTFLIANPSNFRALVQQSTGCQSSNCFKGPINLKFGSTDDEEADIISSDSTISVLEFNYYSDRTWVKEQQQHHQNPEGQKQFCEESEESNSSAGDAFFPTLCPSPTPYSMALDDIIIEDIFLEDLDGDFLSNAVADDSLFFCSY